MMMKNYLFNDKIYYILYNKDSKHGQGVQRYKVGEINTTIT